MGFPKAFGKSVATRDGFESIGGFDTDVKLGENVIFASGLKEYAKTNKLKFYHINSPIYCSLRRFKRIGYSRVLIPWFKAYLGARNLPYTTTDEL